jgi:nucleotide-binding universal stress UspA family protein
MVNSNVTEGEGEALRNSGDELRSILVAVDASNGATRVVSMAARVARPFPDATVHVVHVLRVGRFDRPPPGGSSSAHADALHEANETLQAHVRSAKAQCRNGVVGHFSVGDPTAEILKACAELRADLLVVGTHDLAGFERLLLGSVAETLTRKAGCSVLVVRPVKH